jgi:hypothetical protein
VARALRSGHVRLAARIAADWDVDGVRDDVRDYVIAHLGDPGGVLIADLCRPASSRKAPGRRECSGGCLQVNLAWMWGALLAAAMAAWMNL